MWSLPGTSGRSRLRPHVPQGFPKWTSSPLKHSAADRGCRWIGTSAEWGTPPVFFGAPPDNRMSIVASEGELSPSGGVELSEPDPEMMAMLSRATENVRLMWNS